MCGRFTLTIDPAVLRESFALSAAPPRGLAPRYNIAPTQPVAAVVDEGSGRKIRLFRWGLIPSWAKDPKIGNRMINARAETLAAKPAFRAALKRRRCLVVADGFYEWKGQSRPKTPMYIQLKDGQPFAFAGLWEAWRPPDDAESVIQSCTIVTTEPNTLVAKIHNRMPVIVPPPAYDLWLSAGELTADQLARVLQPYPAAAMKAVAVSPLVNNPAVDSPECVVPA